MHEFEHVYPDETDFEYYDDEDPQLIENQGLYSVYTNCVSPVVGRTLITVTGLVICTLLYRLAAVRVSPTAGHAFSALFGVAALIWNGTLDYKHPFIFGVSCYGVLLLSNRLRASVSGYVTAVYCFGYLLLCEFVVDVNIWRQIRGTQMLLVMKAVSTAFDANREVMPLPTCVQYFGYLYSVSSVLYGPWISFQEYSKENVTLNKSAVYLAGRCLLVSFFCLTVSSCWGYWLLPDSLPEFILVYRDALLFRNSHYFVSFLSRGLSVLAGHDHSPVVRVAAMELPTSLVQVVIHWNIPMHRWLKHYVFRPAQRLGQFPAVLSVYVASAALHGFSGALALVLLSLGFYTYVEYTLRARLAQVMSACVTANGCREQCVLHAHLSRSGRARAVNVLFSALAVLHLAYLGVVFEDLSLMRTTDPLAHTLATWASVGFISHILVVFEYLLYMAIA